MDETDSRLLQQAREGDEAAFSSLCARHLGATYDFALMVTGDPAAASEAVSAAFVRAAAMLRALLPGTEVRPWLLGLTHQAVLAAPRPSAPGVTATLGAVPDGWGEPEAQAAAPSADPWDRLGPVAW